MTPKTLLVRQDHMGDVLLMTPLIRALAKGGMSVNVLCRRDVQPVFIGNPHVTASRAIEEVAPDYKRSPVKLASWMRRERFDICILPFPSPRSLILAGFLGGIRRRLTAGGGIMSRLCGYKQVKTGLPAIARYYAEAHLDFATELGLSGDGVRLDWMVQGDERRWATEFMREKNLHGVPIVGIHPGSGGNTCNPPPSEYGRVARMLLDNTNVSILATGGTHERDLIEGWAAGEPRIINTAGWLTLRQLGALIEKVDVLVAPSTGPLHIASALGIPTVSPFCSRLYLCSQVWGNPNTNACHISAPRAACETWERERGGFCDFRGMVRAEELVDGVRRLLTAK